MGHHHHKKHKRRPRTPRAELFRIARKLDRDPEHAFQVRKNAERLYRGLALLHGLGETGWRLLEAAAVLHDIGHRRGYARHHKHARDMIMERAWPGLSEREREIVACVARYHRKASPKPEHKVYRRLLPTDQALVVQLASILRIADGLDRAHRASISDIQAEIAPDTVILQVKQRWGVPEDLEAGRRKARLFEETFERTVEILACA